MVQGEGYVIHREIRSEGLRSKRERRKDRWIYFGRVEMETRRKIRSDVSAFPRVSGHSDDLGTFEQTSLTLSSQTRECAGTANARIAVSFFQGQTPVSAALFRQSIGHLSKIKIDKSLTLFAAAARSLAILAAAPSSRGLRLSLGRSERTGASSAAGGDDIV